MVLVLVLQRLDTSVSSPLVVRLIRVRVTVCSHCNTQHRLAGKLGPPHTATHVSAVPSATGHGHATEVWYRSHYGLCGVVVGYSVCSSSTKHGQYDRNFHDDHEMLKAETGN